MLCNTPSSTYICVFRILRVVVGVLGRCLSHEKDNTLHFFRFMKDGVVPTGCTTWRSFAVRRIDNEAH